MITDNTTVYLKPNVVIEPFFDRWYAWSHLISPATAARNITGRHLKIMNSYIQAPKIHEAAVKNPKMLGGPFMDLGGKRVDEVKELRDRTNDYLGDLVTFSKAIDELDEMLRTHATGFSMNELYDKIPDELRGYVELVYDLNNNPSYRFFENLLYHSKFYKPEAQSIALWVTNNDERPFVLSTPRLEEPGILHLEIPFKSKSIDELAKMKRAPKTFGEIKEIMNIEEKDEAFFKTLFTEEAFIPYERYVGDKIRMRYLGHACILVETKDMAILIDPLISYYGYQSEVNHFSDYDLPDVIDYVLITHNHQDHILFETLLPLRHKIKNIVVPKSTSGSLQDPNLKLMFNNIGFNNVTEIGDMEEIKFSDECTITGLPFIGEHSDLNIQSKVCHHVKMGEFSLLFLADSCNIENKLYQHVQKIVGDIDVLFLGMECDGAPLTWLYGPLLTEDLPRDKDSSRRLAGCNHNRGMGLVDVFNPQEVYVYAMGMEPWCKFISSIVYTDESEPIVQSNKLVEECESRGITSERLFGEKELLFDKKSYSSKEIESAVV
ncbi:MBL fold metallo-hydrolase [uncultured Kordia sp.]|uniref:MBL fold metallo-hydrolase n=1 Tax=uncultured Kordia sp. TaxID=507699 RepID=UPI00262C6FE0|nr:MBL fold metallo-hydrolase [uncultured Kordia sp.]